MNRDELVVRVRKYVRDTTASIFNKVDIEDYINEAIDRVRNIPALKGMRHLLNRDDVPNLLPEEYHYLLAVYSASRCFSQDERHYQSTVFMNEFENKLEDLRNKIENGEVTIIDDDGNVVQNYNTIDKVKDVYFVKTGGD